MSDDEWQTWQSSWQGVTGPLPDIRARVRMRSRRHRVANVAFFALIAGGLAGFIPLLLGRRDEDRIAGWIVVSFCVALSIGFVWVQRGLGSGSAANPREAVAFLERRLRAEKRGAELARVCFVALGVGMAVHTQWMLTDAGWPVRMFALGFSAIMIAISFAMPWWVRRRVARQDQEIDGWRKWLDDQQL